MAYKINSPRLGDLGSPFVPDENTNVEALLEGGFIVSTSKSAKNAKTEESEQE
jgi:hypothetical protein